MPRLALFSEYRDMMAEQAGNPELRRYLSRCFRKDRELIKTISDRQSSILLEARTIVNRQRDCFLRSSACLIPLKMEDFAGEVGRSPAGNASPKNSGAF